MKLWKAFLALVLASLGCAVKAWPVHGSASPIINAGLSVIQSTIPALSGDYAFIDILRDVANDWWGADATNNQAPVDPSWLDANGYPTAAALSGTSGVQMLVTEVPAASSKQATLSNPFVITWQGTGPITVGVFNYALTFLNSTQCPTCTGQNQPSVLDPSSGLYKGRIEFYPPSYTSGGSPPSFFVTVTSMASGAAFSMNAGNAGIEMHFLSDETDAPGYLTGTQIVNPQYKTIIQQSGAGFFRMMDWLYTNESLTTTWATRKSITYPTYTDDEWRASLYPGDIMTNSGNNYSLTTGSFTLADKLTMHVHFSANDTPITYQTAGSSGSGFISEIPCCMTTSLSPALTINRTGQAFSNGQPVGFLFSGNQPTGMCSCQTYYVVNAGANSFQVATTPGGTPIAPASLNDNTMAVLSFDTLSLNGGPAYPIKANGALPIIPWKSNQPAVYGFSPYNASVKIYGTLVFDSDLQAWLLNGAQSGQSGGLNNSVPIEAILEVCKELGLTPYFSIPFLAMDPMTDYVPSLASLVKSTNPAWVPHFEAGNEIWNRNTAITNYAFAKSWVHWDSSSGTAGDWPNWTGMVTSKVGQAVAAVYGAGGLGAAYHVRAGIQTDSAPLSTGTVVDNVLTSSAYVANGPAQTGYTQTPAYQWADAVQVSNYVSPADRGTIAEWGLAYDYSSTSSGTDLNTYVDTLCGVGCSTNISFTVPYESDRWNRAKTWAANFGVNKMFAYEGGYSPDLMPTYYDLQGPTQSAMQGKPINGTSAFPTNATQAVIDIRQAYTADKGVSQAQQPGNPSVAGMLVYLTGVTGMTQLNCQSGFPVFTASSADVTWTGHNLSVNQRVQFGGNNLPSNITAGQAYYVISTNLTTNTFEFSATRGGSPLVPSASASSGVTVFSAFTVVSTAAGGGVGFNNLTTIDVNTSSYPAATSAATVDYPNSLTLINSFRTATLLHATDMQPQMLKSYNQFVADGGSFPAQYEVSGTQSIWPVVQPDIWGAQSGSLAAITQFNAQ